MKKVVLNNLVIAALVVAAAFTSCNKDNGKGVTTHFRFDKGKPPASLTKSSSPMAGTTVDEVSYKAFIDYYENLGTLVRSYTPTEFTLYLNRVTAWLPEIGDFDLSQNSEEPVDFAKGVTITLPKEIETGHTVNTVRVMFTSAQSRITFTMNDDPSKYYRLIGGYGSEIKGNNVTLLQRIGVMEFLPNSENPLRPHAVFFNSFHFFGTQYRASCVDNTVPNLVRLTDEQIGTPNTGYANSSNLFVIPMLPIEIPTTAKSITFTMNMDLDGIIEQYALPVCPFCSSENEEECYHCINYDNHDVFVMANRWWERLSINVEIK